MTGDNAHNRKGPMPRIFVSVVGQNSNIGDSILRRAYLDCLRNVGSLHVLIEGTSEDYRSGLKLRPGDITYSSRTVWWRAGLSSAVAGRIIVAYNAGEMQLNRTFTFSYAKHLALTLVSRLRGGAAVHVGMGVRRPTRLGKLIGLLLRGTAIVSWRDPLSRAWTGVGEVNPDWGFRTGRSVARLRDETAARETMAIALRGDRLRPGNEWLDVIDSISEDVGVKPYLVVQVERDNDLALELASSRGWEILAWSGGSHEVHEKEVREVYARSLAVVSDRLHALVVGLTEGAVPIGYSPSSTEKLARTMGAAGLGSHVLPDKITAREAKERLTVLLNDRHTSLQLLEESRLSLDRLAARIEHLA